MSHLDIFKYKYQPYEEDIILFAVRGAHSKIPTCCVTFWILYFRETTEEKREEYSKFIPENTNYIPCPDCLDKKQFVKIHMCNRKNKACRLAMDFDDGEE